MRCGKKGRHCEESKRVLIPIATGETGWRRGAKGAVGSNARNIGCKDRRGGEEGSAAMPFRDQEA